MKSSRSDPYSPFQSIRARTGIIFFVGLFLLIGVIFAVALVISQAIRYDSARVALLVNAQSEVDAWAAATAGYAAGSAPSSEVGAALGLLLQGGSLTQAGSKPLLLPSLADDAERAALQQASSTWTALGGADGATRTAHLATLHAALAEAEELVRQRRDGDIGMVRGMYAALFIASLIFLLIGLWFIQQSIVSPLEALHLAVGRIAAGDLDTPAVSSGPGEFRDLTRSFEAMRVELRESRARLELWTSNLEEHVVQRTNQLAALSQVIAAASRSLALEQVLHTALEQSMQALRLEIGGIWLLDETAQDLKLAVSSGMSEALQHQLAAVDLNEYVIGRVGVVGQAFALEDLAHAPLVVRPIALQEGVRGIVAVPIKLRDRVLGVLSVMTRLPRMFTPDEIALLTSVGQQIGIAVDSLRLLEEVREQTQRVAALQERERIGIELHDGLLQMLGYLFLKTDQLESLAAARGFNDMASQLAAQRDVLEHASQDARRFIAELRELPPPPALLSEALADMIVTFGQEHALPVTLQVSGPPLVLDADRLVHLVRIAREALTNAAQHGHASQAVVKCGAEDGRGQLSVCDDGCGFDVNRAPDDGRPHFGLSVMQARAVRIGGALRIESSRGRGACVYVSWALH